MADNDPRTIGRRAAGLSLGGLLLGAGANAAPSPSAAPPAPAAPVLPPFGVAANPEVVTLMGSTLIGTYTEIANDVARMMSAQIPNGPRVLPVLGSGGLQVAWDVTNIERIDTAILSGVVLDVVRRAGWVPDLAQRLTYVTLLYFEETHIISSQLIENVDALAGRTVNVGPLGGGTDVIARRLFDLLGIQPIYDNRPTLDALKGAPTGDPAAVLYIAGKPVQAIGDIQLVGNLRFVPIPWDGERQRRLEPYFRAGFLGSNDYPRLVPVETRVPTVVSPVFMVASWVATASPRQQAISTVITSLVRNLITLQNGPYHPKWREANVLERMPGFRRAPEVMAWFNGLDNEPP
jgi:TRAP-type uncharacterized transport system substrate-binding protein